MKPTICQQCGEPMERPSDNPNTCQDCESPDDACSPLASSGVVHPTKLPTTVKSPTLLGAVVGASLLAMTAFPADLEIQPVAAWELYNRTGEIKGGAGLRGRYWFNEIGVEAQGLSLTPRDSIVDRMDASVCYRQQFGNMAVIGSAGYGRNNEDHAHGPGIGMAVQYNRGKWFMEAGTRSIWEDHSKSLLTFGIGRRF